MTNASTKTRRIGRNDLINFLPNRRRGIEMIARMERVIVRTRLFRPGPFELGHPSYRSFLHNAVIIFGCIDVVEKPFGPW